MEPVPGTAESWTVSPDGRRYDFTIREDARWSDGTPVTAHDFAYAWRRLQDPDFAAEYAYILHFVRYAEEYNLYRGQAEALETVVGEALPALREREGEVVAREAWLAFAAEHELADRSKASPDPAIAALLAAEGPAVSVGDAAALLARESARRLEVF